METGYLVSLGSGSPFAQYHYSSVSRMANFLMDAYIKFLAVVMC